MNRTAVQDLSSVIRANTQRRTLEELAVGGKKSFRVISGSRVMELIHAVVDDAIQREALEMVQADRDRIVSQTKQQFDRVLKFQSKQDEDIRRERARTQEAETRVQAAVDAAQMLERLLEEEKAKQGETRAALKVEVRSLREDYAAREQQLSLASERELAQFKAEIKRLRKHIVRLKQERTDLLVSFEADQGKLAAGQEQALGEAQTQIEKAESELVRRRHQIDALQSDGSARHQRLVDEHKTQLQGLRAEHLAMMTRLESDRGEVAGRQGQALAEARRRIKDLEVERDRLLRSLKEAETKKAEAEKALGRLQARLASAGTAIEGAKQEMIRLKSDLAEATGSVERYRREIEERDKKLSSVREKTAERSVTQLRDEMAELSQLVRNFGKRPAGIEEGAFDRLAEQFGSQRSAMEERFDNQMEKTLSEVTRVLRVATAQPIDEEVVATDALVESMFDDTAEMKSNVDELEVEERTSQSGISDHLERLREARGAFQESSSTE